MGPSFQIAQEAQVSHRGLECIRVLGQVRHREDHPALLVRGPGNLVEGSSGWGEGRLSRNSCRHIVHRILGRTHLHIRHNCSRIRLDIGRTAVAGEGVRYTAAGAVGRDLEDIAFAEQV